MLASIWPTGNAPLFNAAVILEKYNQYVTMLVIVQAKQPEDSGRIASDPRASFNTSRGWV